MLVVRFEHASEHLAIRQAHTVLLWSGDRWRLLWSNWVLSACGVMHWRQVNLKLSEQVHPVQANSRAVSGTAWGSSRSLIVQCLVLLNILAAASISWLQFSARLAAGSVMPQLLNLGCQLANSDMKTGLPALRFECKVGYHMEIEDCPGLLDMVGWLSLTCHPLKSRQCHDEQRSCCASSVLEHHDDG